MRPSPNPTQPNPPPPLQPAYSDDLLLIAHTLPQLLEYVEAIVHYLADVGMSLNVLFF